MEYDLVYAVAGDRELRIKIALPEPAPGDPVPVLVYIHGGGWQSGSYDDCRWTEFVKNGYASASIQYRFSQEAIFPAQIHDCKAAIRFLKANAKAYGLDASRVGVWGGSAGGHLAALLGTSADIPELEGDLGNPEQSTRVQAVCSFYGPTKFLPEDGEAEPVTQVPEVATQFFGGTREEKPELHRLASPFAHISADDPPFLLVHGDADDLVPLGQSEMLCDALRRAGVEAELITVKNGNHGFHLPDQEPGNEEIMAQVLAFFDRHLRCTGPTNMVCEI